MLSCRVPHSMNVNVLGFTVWSLAVLVGTPALAHAQNTRPDVEEIYIARSVRESRVMPTEFCAQAKTGFISILEDQYTFRSTTTRAADGRMTSTNVKTIGRGRGCLGRTANPAVLNFYLELVLGQTTFKWIGECPQTMSDFPEKGLAFFHCVLRLSDPRGPYVGGQLTTNTMTSLKDLGLQTDPPGYTQSSIATIRLWKKRVDRSAP
jgi:hypothetical protein